jgi:hypothetical protein
MRLAAMRTGDEIANGEGRLRELRVELEKPTYGVDMG